MKKEIVYYPFDTGVNQYGQRMKEIFSRFGTIEKISYRKMLTSPFNKKELGVVNWVDNQFLNSKGNISFLGVLKVYLKLVLLKLNCKKIVYIRHNVYPHNTHPSSIRNLTRMTDRLCRFFDTTFVHSPVFSHGFEKYIPHPLYQYPLTKAKCDKVQRDDDLYIIFGRIVRYKKIDEVIKFFPKNKKLIIAGFCEDELYRDELNALVSKNNNIEIISRFLNDDEAGRLVESANAMIISHADEDMIVSGSFFYALSQRISIICVETPFMRWGEKILSSDVVQTASSIPLMCGLIKQDRKAYIYTDDKINEINQLFGDEYIANEMDKILSLSNNGS